MNSATMSSDMPRFHPLQHLVDRQLGQPIQYGTQDSLCSALYSTIAITQQTPSTPCKGEDWGSTFGFGFSPDGSILAAACENKCVLVYDALNAKLIKRRFQTHDDCVNCIRFLDNRLFATCSDDTTVRLWDCRYLKSEIRVLRGHTSWVKNIEYASAKGKLITSGFDGNIFAWDVNNYSENEQAEPMFYINGTMRTKMTPDESKLIVSTLGGYFLLIHDLDLDHLKDDLLGFKPHLYRLMQLMNTPLHHALQYNYMFTRHRNRVEFMCDFPDADNAESISTMQIHPQGWCVVSRNTTLDEESEWTCVHDIQTIDSGSKLDTNFQDFLNSSESPEVDDLSQAGTSDHPSSSLHINGASSSNSFNSGQRRIVSSRNLINHLPDFNEPYHDSDDSSGSEMSSDDGDSTQQILRHHRNRRPALAPQLAKTSSDSSCDETSVSSNRSRRSFLTTGEPVVGANLDNSDNDDEEDSDFSTLRTGAEILELMDNSPFSEQHDSRLRQRSNIPNTSVTRSVRTHNDHRDDSSPSGLVLYEAIDISQRGDIQRRVRLRDMSREGLQSVFLQAGNFRIRNVKPRLLYYTEEPNVGRGFIKEQSFSPDGRVIASPFGNTVRLLAFDQRCSELCDNVPSKPRPLKQVAMCAGLQSSILASTFSPIHCCFVAGCRDGSIAFCQPRL